MNIHTDVDFLEGDYPEGCLDDDLPVEDTAEMINLTGTCRCRWMDRVEYDPNSDADRQTQEEKLYTNHHDTTNCALVPTISVT